MGDYQKLFVNAEVRANVDELKAKVAELGLTESAYHCGGHIEEIKASRYRSQVLQVTLLGQTKYGYGQEEFLDWLAPFVVTGSGPAEVWAMQFDEYRNQPTIRSVRAMNEEHV